MTSTYTRALTKNKVNKEVLQETIQPSRKPVGNIISHPIGQPSNHPGNQETSQPVSQEKTQEISWDNLQLPSQEVIQEFNFILRKLPNRKFTPEIPAEWLDELNSIAYKKGVKKNELYRYVIGKFLGKVEK